MAPFTQKTPTLALALAAALYGYRLAAGRLNSASLSVSTKSALLTSLSGVSFVGVFYLTMLLAKNILLVPGQLLPAILVAKLIDRKKLIEDSVSSHVGRVKIPVSNTGVVLDAVEIRTQTVAPTDKWVIWFNANGVPYEQILTFLEDYSSKVRVNVLAFNFRGVGDSTGWPYVSQDLGDDGAAAVEYIMAKGVPESNILLHGHSIGGGASAMTAKQYPLCPRVNDRSFRTLKAAVVELIDIGLGGLMGALFGLVMGTTYYIVVWAGGPATESSQHGILMCWIVGVGLGIVLNKFGIIAQVAPTVLSLLHWDMNAEDLEWPVDKTLIIYHEFDGMIAYHGASLHYKLEEDGHVTNGFALGARRDPMHHHMYPLNEDPTEWTDVAQRIHALFP